MMGVARYVCVFGDCVEKTPVKSAANPPLLRGQLSRENGMPSAHTITVLTHSHCLYLVHLYVCICLIVPIWWSWRI